MKSKAVQFFFRKPAYFGLLIIGLLIIGLVIILISRRGSNTKQTQIKEGQIQIVKGDEIITINQSGLVEYRSKDKTYYDTWDTSQISSFFSMMEKKARDYMSKRTSGGDCGYKVFMFIDKKLVSICIDSNDEDMVSTVEPVFIKYSDVSLSDYFGEEEDSGGEDEDGGFDGVISFPTSTPIAARSTATPTPYSIYNINTNYAPVKADCDTWSESIVRNRAIISNTYCTVDTTPTPVP